KVERQFTPPLNECVGNFIKIVINRSGPATINDGVPIFIDQVTLNVSLENVFPTIVLSASLACGHKNWVVVELFASIASPLLKKQYARLCACKWFEGIYVQTHHGQQSRSTGDIGA